MFYLFDALGELVYNQFDDIKTPQSEGMVYTYSGRGSRSLSDCSACQEGNLNARC